jgi:hypothetical protein
MVSRAYRNAVCSKHRLFWLDLISVSQVFELANRLFKILRSGHLPMNGNSFRRLDYLELSERQPAKVDVLQALCSNLKPFNFGSTSLTRDSISFLPSSMSFIHRIFLYDLGATLECLAIYMPIPASILKDRVSAFVMTRF